MAKYSQRYDTDTNTFVKIDQTKSTPASNTRERIGSTTPAPAAKPTAGHSNQPTFTQKKTPAPMGSINPNKVAPIPATRSTKAAPASSAPPMPRPRPSLPGEKPSPLPRAAGAAARTKAAGGSAPVNLYEGFQVHKDTGTFAFPPKQISKNPANTKGTAKQTKPYTKGGNAGAKSNLNGTLTKFLPPLQTNVF